MYWKLNNMFIGDHTESESNQLFEEKLINPISQLTGHPFLGTAGVREQVMLLKFLL